MTREKREEAIEELTDLLPEEFLMDYADAIRMGIEALKQEPCEDCISREAVIKTITEWFFSKEFYYTNATEYLRKRLDELPPVTPQPKIWHWIEHIHNEMHYIECPKCSSWFLRMYLTRNSYCPNCGAKMQEMEE